jgi:hypothetical protein
VPHVPQRYLPRKKLEMECLMCGVIFEATRDDAKNCSPRCRVAYYRLRNADLAMGTPGPLKRPQQMPQN